MNTTNAAVLTGTLVTLGEWSADRPLSPKYIVGGAFLALSLGALDTLSPELAQRFATLIVVVVLFRYGPAIFHKFGLINDKTYADAKEWKAA